MISAASDDPSLHYVVLANPSPKSFDHGIVSTYCGEVRRQGQLAEMIDLYAAGFDPVLPDRHRPDRTGETSAWIAAQLARLQASAVILFVYPIWFGGPPAILKGYIDRVIGARCDLSQFQRGAAQPAVRGKWMLTISTSGSSQEWLRAQGQERSLRSGWDLYLERGFGMRDGGHLALDRIVPNMSSAHARACLDRVGSFAARMCERLARERGCSTCEAPVDSDLE